LTKQLREDTKGTKGTKEFQKLLQLKADDAELCSASMDNILLPLLIGGVREIDGADKGSGAVRMGNLGR
jgi:hypothetical protein